MAIDLSVPAEPSADISKEDLDTPVLCLDLDAMEANIKVVAANLAEYNIQWRPHSKAYKSPIIARKLIDAGAIGVTCAKLGEAEVMANEGVTDILVANLIVGEKKLRRLAALTKIADPIICIDHIDQLTTMSEIMQQEGTECRAIIEINIGLDRVGIEPGEPTLALAKAIHTAPGVKFAGIMGYEGHLLCIADDAEKEQQINAALDILGESAEAIKAADIPCEIVSCGGTGSYLISRKHPAVTELQCGGVIMMDQFYETECKIEGMQKALTVLATIVSRPTEERAVIDAGRKTYDMSSTDPIVLQPAGITVTRQSAEQGEKLLHESARNLSIGDRLEIVPGYSDMTCVLHNHFYAFRNNELEAIIPIASRGFLR